MLRLILLTAAIALGAGGVYFYSNYDVEIHCDYKGKLEYVRVVPKGQQGRTATGAAAAGPEAKPVRIATLNLGLLEEKRWETPKISSLLVKLLSQFDVVALQDVRARNQGPIVRLLGKLNVEGRKYNFATSPYVRTGDVQQYSAFLFDAARIEIDRGTVQMVEDPQRRFSHPPLVALFRVRGPDEKEAFTFKLINVHTEPQRAAQETELLDDVYRAVRDDRPLEDDIILLGDFGTVTDRIESLKQIPDLGPSIADTPTTFRSNATVDNIFFNRRATIEFTGRAEVFDVERDLGLEPQEAQAMFEHLPVWAEFSPYEGGDAGPVAARNDRAIRF